MSEINIATIITPNHLDKAYAMLASMSRFQKCHLHILMVNVDHENIKPPNNDNVTFYKPDDIFNGSIGRINRLSFLKYKIVQKDRPAIIAQHDYLRWSLKAGFVHHLLQQYEIVTYCDCDLHFYNDFKEIIDFASDKSLTISPHWRTIHSNAADDIQYNFRHGLYNGGFFIGTRQGLNILEWWAERCCIECSATSETTYVDQKYLDLVPLYFDNVGIIKHKGCNVAAWNAAYLPRTINDNEVLVDGYKIIFIHYSPITIKYIEKGIDIHLTEHLAEYKASLSLIQLGFLRMEGGKRFTTVNLDSIDIP